MPRPKPFKDKIPYIYKKNPEDLIMLGFVRAVNCHLQTVSESRAIIMFLIKFNLSEDDYSIESAQRSYRRMKFQFPNICECGTVKEHEKKTGITGIVQRNAENFILFGWMTGIIHVMPTIEIIQGIKLYLRATGISQNELYDRYESYRKMLSEYNNLLNIK
jgi:hypothetical protein